MRYFGYAIALFVFYFSPLHLYGQAVNFPKDTMVVESGSRLLRHIVITGKTRTRHQVIFRELSVQSGDTIFKNQQEAIAILNEKRLYTISIFNEVAVQWQNVGQDSIDMLIRVDDRFPVFPEGNLEFADRNFNVWWKEQNHSLRRINLGLTLTNNNFRGNRENLSVTGQIGFTQKVGISYSRPYIDKQQKHGFGVSFFGLQNREIAYNTINNKLAFYRDDNYRMLRRTDISGWYTYRPGYAVTHSIRFTWQHFWISSKAVQLNSGFLGEGLKEADNLWLQYRIEWNQVDNWNYPLRGGRFIGLLDEKLLLPNHQFQSSVYLQMDRYLNPFPNWYAAFIFRGRFSFPEKQPYIFRQNLGYDFDYIRGYEYYVIDGAAFALGRIDLKRCLLDYHFRLPIRYFELVPIKIYAKAFGDMGLSYNKYPENDFLNNKMLYSAGIGLDIVTFYDIKLRIEYTFNSLGEKGLFLHKNGE